MLYITNVHGNKVFVTDTDDNLTEVIGAKQLEQLMRYDGLGVYGACICQDKVVFNPIQKLNIACNNDKLQSIMMRNGYQDTLSDYLFLYILADYLFSLRIGTYIRISLDGSGSVDVVLAKQGIDMWAIKGNTDYPNTGVSMVVANLLRQLLSQYGNSMKLSAV